MPAKINAERLEALKTEYTENRKSGRQLANEYGISETYLRVLAKRHGWERDQTASIRSTERAVSQRRLAERGRPATPAQEGSDPAPAPPALTDEQVREASAAALADLRAGQQDRVDQLGRIAQMHLSQLHDMVFEVTREPMQAAIEKILEAEEVSMTHYRNMAKLLDVGSRAQAIKTTVDAVSKLHDEQRVAYLMTDGRTDQAESLEDHLLKMADDLEDHVPPEAPEVPEASLEMG